MEQLKLTPEFVQTLSKSKNEPLWMTQFRLDSLENFNKLPQNKLLTLDFSNNHSSKEVSSDNLYASEIVHQQLMAELEEKGVIFLTCDDALKKHPELFRKYFATIINNKSKMDAFNGACWISGVFIYVPPGVQIKTPLQAFFRTAEEKSSQVERTLIVVDQGASLEYVEGCTAPTYVPSALHNSAVEVIVENNAKCRYITIQNWSDNIVNIVSQKALVAKNASMEWVDTNLGSKHTIKHPCCYLAGENATGNVYSFAIANNQQQEIGAQIHHQASNTHSQIFAKTIVQKNGHINCQPQINSNANIENACSKVTHEELHLLENSISPYTVEEQPPLKLTQKISVSPIPPEQIFYLMSRGFTKEEAVGMLLKSFVDPIVKKLPMEYAIELNRMLELAME